MAVLLQEFLDGLCLFFGCQGIDQLEDTVLPAPLGQVFDHLGQNFYTGFPALPARPIDNKRGQFARKWAKVRRILRHLILPIFVKWLDNYQALRF